MGRSHRLPAQSAIGAAFILLIAGLLGVLFLVLAVVYWLTPAGTLPSFLPGFEPGGDHVHLKHALGSLVAALILFAFAWFQRERERW